MAEDAGRDEADREAAAVAERAAALARVSLTIACLASASAILGLFLPL
jgi:hypothetical protein